MGETAIEWATDVWNPTTGCDRVSPGCAHCYALELAPRLRRFARARHRKAIAEGKPHTPGKWLNVADGGKASGPAFGLTLHPEVLEQPLRWRRPRTIFVNSMSDLFHEDVPEAFIERVFAVMASCPQHTFQILTKRPERMVDVVPRINESLRRLHMEPMLDPLPNVWLGVSIENRRFVHRADVLRATPAAVRFISAEPLLGPLLMDAAHLAAAYEDETGWSGGYEGDELDLTGIDWLIVGGESGKGHRPIREEWVRDLRDACLTRGGWSPAFADGSGPVVDCPTRCGDGVRPKTAFFFKQWGGPTPKAGGRELDSRTWDELPTTQDIEASGAPALAAVTTNDEESR